MTLHSSHPGAPKLKILSVSSRQRAAGADFGSAVQAGEPFALLVADAFDKGISREDWLWIKSPVADPELVAASLQSWQTEVLPRFSAHYGLIL